MSNAIFTLPSAGRARGDGDGVVFTPRYHVPGVLASRLSDVPARHEVATLLQTPLIDKFF